MPSESIRIVRSDGPTLAGTLELPSGERRGAALFAHCFTCTRHSKAAVAVSRELSDRGIACLRFDFTGLGDSEGEFGADSFPADVADVTAACAWLVERFGPEAAHELLREVDPVRLRALAAIDAFLDGVAA